MLLLLYKPTSFVLAVGVAPDEPGMWRLSSVGCEPLRSRTVLNSQVLAETTCGDGWSGAETSGWKAGKTHIVTWPLLTKGDVDYLEVIFEDTGMLYTPVLVEVEGQEPIVGRMIEKPRITHMTALAWSAEVRVVEDF